ncbi:MAG: phospholipase D-like domain-containing protein [Raineya sp.]|jgi:phosphatidylserine/phosphatidylglycerophosphate/cardiolipin synthase-like enzyme|nr:phospholipase D-like domain-containing protein [Raineya sp.]
MKKIYFFLFFLIVGKTLAQVEPIGTARVKLDGSVVTVTGIVTNDATFDNRNRVRSFQDATGGLGIFAQNSPSAPVLQALKQGDSIVVTGTLSQFFNLKQLVEPLTITVISSNKPLPAPKITTIAELQNPAVAEALESMLVKIEDVNIDTGDAIFGSGTGGRNYDIDDPKSPVSGNCFPLSPDCTTGPVIRVTPGNPLVGTDIPKGTVTVIGNLEQNSTTYRIVLRGRADIVLGLVIENVLQESIKLNSFKLTFTTNQRAKTRVRWGSIFLVDVSTTDPTNYVANYDTTFVGEINITDLNTKHEVNITGLNEASLYFVEVFCQNAEGNKNTILTDVYTTASQSTGDIKIFFNRSVDASFSRNGAVPFVTNDMAQVIADYINKAQTSVDVSIYNANAAGAAKIATALNNAQIRGVQVRYIFGGESANTANTLIPTILKMRDRNTTGDAALQRTGTGNHNKFIIIDPNSTLNSYVITGSGNYTDNNLFTDPNNFLVIQDQALARAYRVEFDEMWGEGPVSLANPDRQKKSRLGAQKIKNTPSKFVIGDRVVELAFSPSDKTTNAIRKAIYSADNDVRFGLLLITSDDLRTPLDSMQNVGWDVKGLIDDENAVSETSPLVQGSDFVWLRDKGVNVNAYVSSTSQLHHKYVVIDAVRTNSDPLVVTGSHNWSSGAETSNDENTLIIHDAKIANMYRQEFGQRWFEATGIRDAYVLALDEPTNEKSAVIYPNPSQGKFKIQFDRTISSEMNVKIIDLQGKLIQNQTVTMDGSELEMNTNLLKGMYILQIGIGEKTFTRKMVVTK